MILKNADKIRFKEEGHIHEMLIDGEWTEVPGATSISGLFQEDGWKFAWPVKLMEEKLFEMAKESYDKSELELAGHGDVRRYEGIKWDWNLLQDNLKKAKNAWREKRDKAADTGVAGHLIISQYILEKIKNEPR
jgi:hypothetical protein